MQDTHLLETQRVGVLNWAARRWLNPRSGKVDVSNAPKG